MNLYEPHTWVGFAGLVLAGIVSVAVAAVGNRSLLAVRKQVENGHGSNLRDDLDSIMVALRDLKRDVGGLREEMRTERLERIEGDRRR